MVTRRTENNFFLDYPYLIETRIQAIGAKPSQAVKPAWYLSRLYGLAKDYRKTVDFILSIQPERKKDVFASTKRIREITKDIKQYADRFAIVYSDTLDYYLDVDNDRIEKGVDEINSSFTNNYSVEEHKHYYKTLNEKFQSCGCDKHITKRIVEDILGLLWELDGFLDKMDNLFHINEDNKKMVESLLLEISILWIPTYFHLRYHLGDFDGSYSGLYNPGVIGWSLAALSEMAK